MIVPAGARLLVQVPGQPIVVLRAGEDDAFVDPVSGYWVPFQRGLEGTVFLTALRDGAILRAAKQ
jgi:hypothetical protein